MLRNALLVAVGVAAVALVWRESDAAVVGAAVPWPGLDGDADTPGAADAWWGDDEAGAGFGFGDGSGGSSGAVVDEFKGIFGSGSMSGQQNLIAFKAMIAFAEGTANARGYNTIYGYEYFVDFSDHPRRTVCKGGLCSAAAGKYQIMPATWDTVIQPALKLPDFSPPSQELACDYLIKYRGAMADVLAGRFDSAVFKCRKEWASLPGANYAGQSMRKLADLRAVYEQSGGVYA